MELAKGGEVCDKIVERGCLEEKEARRIMFQVLTAVSQLHSLGIVHRDIKPENLLFYDKRDCSKVLVADFGLSEYEEELSNYSPICGQQLFWHLRYV